MAALPQNRIRNPSGGFGAANRDIIPSGSSGEGWARSTTSMEVWTVEDPKSPNGRALEGRWTHATANSVAFYSDWLSHLDPGPDAVSVVPGDRVYFRVAFEAVSIDVGTFDDFRAYVKCELDDGTGVHLENEDGTDWRILNPVLGERYVFDGYITVPAGGLSVALTPYVITSAGPTGAVFRVSETTLDVNPPEPVEEVYRDGNSDGWTWAGTEYMSASGEYATLTDGALPTIDPAREVENAVRNPAAGYGDVGDPALGWEVTTVGMSTPIEVVDFDSPAGNGRAFELSVTHETATDFAVAADVIAPWTADLDLTSPVEPGDVVFGRCSMKWVSPSDGPLILHMLRARFYDAAGSSIAVHNLEVGDAPAVGEWYGRAGSTVAPEGAAFVALYPYWKTGVGVPVTDLVLRWTAALLVVSPADEDPEPDYFDGSTRPETLWTGTPHLSRSVLRYPSTPIEPEEPTGGSVPTPEWPVAGVIVAPPVYTYVLCDEAGSPRAEVELARNRRLSFVRNQAAVANLNLNLDAAAAYALARVLANGTPRLKVYQDGDLRFYGYWTPQRDQAGGSNDGMELTFKSPFARYEEAFTGHGDATYEALDRDAGLIAWDLLAMYSLGLRQGTITPTTNRDRHYESKQIAEAVVQLTEVIDGFDFTEVFVEDDPLVLAEFNAHPPSGEDRTEVAIFEYGEGTVENVQGVVRELRPPVNFVRVVGEEGLFAEALDQPSIDRYGHYGKVLSASSGTVEQATLQARADAELRPTLQRVVTFTPDPTLSPRPWVDYDPVRGDLVAVRAHDGALIVNETVRVNGLELALDDEGNEATHTLLYEQEGEFLPDETGFPPEMGEGEA